ncbi:MAG: DEAD/DEAH box helicase [Myxococcota bacterium]
MSSPAPPAPPPPEADAAPTSPDEGATSGFAALALDPRLLAAIDDLGFEQPTDVQAGTIPPLLAGRHVVGQARTGSGKTAAFGLALLERLKEGGPNRALVLAPTRELAVQVAAALRTFSRKLPSVRIATIYGGAAYPPQLKALAAGPSVIVGTPGRVIDMFDRGALDLSRVEVLILDEADEMLRMGFIDDVEKLIAATPEERQVVLFSATMPPRIRAVADTYLHDPVAVAVERHGISVDHIAQRYMLVPQRFKPDALVRVLRAIARGTTLVFARTRAACADLAERLTRDGFEVDALHGDLNQSARDRVMKGMRAQRLRIVIATDIAARGLDVEHIEHVVNYDFPDDMASYVHRIGRTGRAGRDGMAISLITPRERRRIRELERRLRQTIEELPAPTDLEIAGIEQAALVESVLAATEDERDVARAHLQTALADTELSAEDVAAAALHALAEERGISLRRPHDEGPPAWARRPPRVKPGDRPRRHDGGPRRPRDIDVNEVELRFPVGFRKGVRPGDLVGLLANEAGIEGRSIGRIDIQPFESFVALPRAVAEHVLDVLPRASVRGIDVPISPARSDRRPPPDRPSRPFRKARPGGGSGGPGGGKGKKGPRKGKPGFAKRRAGPKKGGGPPVPPRPKRKRIYDNDR